MIEGVITSTGAGVSIDEGFQWKSSGSQVFGWALTQFILPAVMKLLVGTTLSGRSNLAITTLLGLSSVGPTLVTDLGNEVTSLGWSIAADTNGLATLINETEIGTGLIGFFIGVATAAIATKNAGLLATVSIVTGALGLILQLYERNAHTSNLDFPALLFSGISFLTACMGFTTSGPSVLVALNGLGLVLGLLGLAVTQGVVTI